MRGLFGLGALVVSLLASPASAAGTGKMLERHAEHGTERRAAAQRSASVRETFVFKRGTASRRAVKKVAEPSRAISTRPYPRRLGPSIGTGQRSIFPLASTDKALLSLRSFEVHVGAASTRLTESAALLIGAKGKYDVVATFDQRRVWMLVTARPVELFRVHGEHSDPRSPWFACCETLVDGVRRMDGGGRALHPDNTQTSLTTVRVPQGTTLYVGIAADMQYELPRRGPVKKRGGALQIFSPELADKMAAGAVVRHEYRRRPASGAMMPAQSSDGVPQPPIEMRLDLPPQTGTRLKTFELPDAPSPPSAPSAPSAAPARDELAPPQYWFDQISFGVRRAASRAS